MTRTYTDAELLDPNFPDPRRSNAGPLIDKYYEQKGAALLDQAIQETIKQQRTDHETQERTDQAMQATNEAQAAGWFAKLFGKVSK